jgi:diguanylate cyclase (GGDEF)-like protein/PAS domain S-box-containing protein
MDSVEARGLNHSAGEFPVLPAPPASAVHNMRTPVVEAPVALKVLCVDDCEDDVTLIVEALKAGGFLPEYERVCTRLDLDAALDARTWDLVVSDYSMPQLNGLQVLERVRERRPELPFVLVSGAVGQETAVAAMKSGAGDYIMKDDLTRLVPAVRRELAEAGGRRARRLAESNLRASETLLNSIVNTAADGIIVIDESGMLEFVNAAIERMFGWKPLEVIGRNFDSLLMPRSTAGGDRLATVIDGNTRGLSVGVGREVRAQRKDGSVFPMELTLGEMRIDGRIKYACIMRDVTERKCAEERIHQLAHYDKLTGLPNRALFSQLLEQALAEAKYSKKQVAVLFIDLDRFKLINDSLSHDSGDMVLKQVARRLTEAQLKRNTIARFGGDEFVVLMRDCEIPTDAAEAAQRMLTAIAQPLLLEGQEYNLTASIGISAFPSDGENPQTILKNADIAMYRAKEHGKNNYQFYSSQMNLHSFERLVLERFLRHALDQDEFRVYYQPKVDLVSGCITGMEALLRWIHPAMGMISPTKFIPLAEETGLIVPIGAWVLKAACAQNKIWSDQGLPPLRVAVNLSARQFAQDDLHATILNVLEETGLAPELLELEITESVTMDNPEHAAALLRKLKALGIRLAIDDFGTGYSSLSYLKRFPIDNVKIDRSFIKDIPHDEDDVAITQAVIAMAHSLGLKVIAEGVESEEHVTFLRDHGCEQAQGYLFGAPMSAEEFTNLVIRTGTGVLPRATPGAVTPP